MCRPLSNDNFEDNSRERQRRKRSFDAATELVTVSINDLWPYSDISVSVAVVNAIGVGRPSTPIKLETLEGGEFHLMC
jgi:hypothetical protein